MNLAQRKKKLRQTGYWCSLEISEIGFVAVFFVLLITMMFQTPAICYRNDVVDLAKTTQDINLPAAVREDAMEIAIMRDGTIFFGQHKVIADQVAAKIADRVRLGSERKVYIRADRRTKYGDVSEVLNAVRDARIEHIAFITERPCEVVEP